MSKVCVELSMSLDSFIAGLNDGLKMAWAMAATGFSKRIGIAEGLDVSHLRFRVVK